MSKLDAAHSDIERPSARQSHLSLPPESVESMCERLQVMQRLARDEFDSMHADAAAHTAEIIAAAAQDARRAAAAAEQDGGEALAVRCRPAPPVRGEAEWVLPPLPDSDLVPVRHQHLDGALIIDLVRTHPRVLLDGVPLNNPYYIPPEEFLDR